MKLTWRWVCLSSASAPFRFPMGPFTSDVYCTVNGQLVSLCLVSLRLKVTLNLFTTCKNIKAFTPHTGSTQHRPNGVYTWSDIKKDMNYNYGEDDNKSSREDIQIVKPLGSKTRLWTVFTTSDELPALISWLSLTAWCVKLTRINATGREAVFELWTTLFPYGIDLFTFTTASMTRSCCGHNMWTLSHFIDYYTSCYWLV